MEQILDVLYNYIQENRIAYYLNGDPEYCLAGRRMDEAEEWLGGQPPPRGRGSAANLPPEARARLERLAAARAERDFRYERALFRCGLGLGLELAGSGRLPG